MFLAADRFGQLVAAGVFADKAVALRVDENAVVDRVGNGIVQSSVINIGHRIQLNVFHIY